MDPWLPRPGLDEAGGHPSIWTLFGMMDVLHVGCYTCRLLVLQAPFMAEYF
jgi:hypothetical protein